MPNGLEIDLDEGFAKLTERQFGGNPGRAFSELIQNAIDSYPNDTPWDERMGEISTGPNRISIKDYGEGMNSERLKLLITLGGSDKSNDPNKIGQFGMGFMSMFNRRLGTKKISVKTRCEGQVAELVFTVKEKGKRPEISISLTDEKIPFSTLITAEFDNFFSVSSCLDYARRSLKYYPCKIKIDGVLFESIWEIFGKEKTKVFNEEGCRGSVRYGTDYYNMTLLCKFECVMRTTLDHFITGGHNAHYNLEDYYTHGTPYIPDVEIVLNADRLSLTISRDSFYLDYAYQNARGILIKHLKSYLLREIRNGAGTDIVLANQFIFRHEISSYLANPDDFLKDPADDKLLIEQLATIPAYRINGRPGKYSIKELKNMKRSDLPFYYSPERTNLRWLGGAFKHDYIVLPEKCLLNRGASYFYDNLFLSVFRDIVNLDTIQGNQSKIVDLVNREIISMEDLSPKTTILGIKNLGTKEKDLLTEIDMLLADPAILKVIENNLHMKVKSIESAFFDMEEAGCRISSGLFDQDGNPLNEKFISNFLSPAADEESHALSQTRRLKILLGLNLKHPFIQYLLKVNDNQRNYYGLTYLAHELALCQKMLVPFSPFYHLVKQRLAQDMRKALIKNLLAQLNN